MYYECQREKRSRKNQLSADLVDLHGVRVLKEEEIALRSDQAGDGVNHSSIFTRLSWDQQNPPHYFKL